MSGVVVVVDPWSTGGVVAAGAKARGYDVIGLWSVDANAELRGPKHCPPQAVGLKYFAEVEEQESVESTAAAVNKALKSMPLLAVIAGGDTGVTLADALSDQMGVMTNGSKNLPGSRRDKAMQQDAIRASGCRAVRQAKGTKWEEVATFAATESFPLVVKPTESAGSDGVKVCRSIEEAEAHFNLLMTSQRQLGSASPAVLVQEFLKGSEYIVDHVSLDGIHKTMMIWAYDKRPANGSDFVCYGAKPVDDPYLSQILITYTRKVLDALKIKHGPTHGEVIMTDDGPCLVEMNCRCCGIDGAAALVQNVMLGYSQVECALDSYLDRVAFDKVPDAPVVPYTGGAGQIVHLVSMSAGVITATPGYEKIKSMKSLIRLMPEPYKTGDTLCHSVDLFSLAGLAILASKDKRQIEADVAQCRAMEQEGTLFKLETAAISEEDVPDMTCMPRPARGDAGRIADITRTISES
jgi:hypothetical protein